MMESCLFMTSLIVCTSLFHLRKERETREALEEEVKKWKQLREEERIARIELQKQKRKETFQREGYTYHPIGYLESPFPNRRGTPRQPLLVPAARGFIRFNKQQIQYEFFEELKQFSHIWVLFVFHDNTNIEKQSIMGKIKPPRLYGKKVGCLSTRSPHRPNNLGLSVCEIISVGSDYLEICGIDMLHGTPIVDIKPYIPYDIVPSTYTLPMRTLANGTPLPMQSLRVPNWVVDSDIPMLSVQFPNHIINEVKWFLTERNALYASNNNSNTKKNKKKVKKQQQQQQSIPMTSTDVLSTPTLSTPTHTTTTNTPIIPTTTTSSPVFPSFIKLNPFFTKTTEEWCELVAQVLRQDIRGVHQGRGRVGTTNNNNKNKDETVVITSAISSVGNSSNNNSSGVLTDNTDMRIYGATLPATVTATITTTSTMAATATTSAAAEEAAAAAVSSSLPPLIQLVKSDYSCTIDSIYVAFSYTENGIVIDQVLPLLAEDASLTTTTGALDDHDEEEEEEQTIIQDP
jgi:tRNA-Thr(GGU) m(6)t(6)A37 methyltransferase TsaA